MKRTLLSLLLLLGCTLALLAQQQKVVLTLKDGTKMFWTVSQIDSLSITDPDDPASAKVGEAVDLGLSVQWSDINLGADQPSDLGYLVGWGDPTGTELSPTLAPLTNIIGTQYDIATALWKGEWRLPSDDDINELIDKCTWKFDSQQHGWTVTGPSGKSIFLPLSGWRDGNVVEQQGKKGYYWTGILAEDSQAAILHTTLSEYLFTSVKYSLGCAVRPVKGAYNPGITSISATYVDGSADETSARFTVAMEGNYLENVSEAGVLYGTSQASLRTSGTRFPISALKGGASTTATATITGLTPGTTYYYTAYAVYKGEATYGSTTGSFATDRHIDPVTVTGNLVEKGATSAVVTAAVSGTTLTGISELGIVWSQREYPTLAMGDTLHVVGLPDSNQASFTLTRLSKGTRYYVRGYVIAEGETVYSEQFLINTNTRYVTPAGVDLGLSVTWGDRNMGADKVTHPGLLVGFGDGTAASTTNYSTSNDIIGTNEDPVFSQLSQYWRSPSDEEIEELLTSCTWTWTTESDGTKGYRVTASNGNSIFLPVTGQRDGETLSDLTSGYYWSGIGSTATEARALLFTSGNHRLSTLRRAIGAAIRPVAGTYGVSVSATHQNVAATTATIVISVEGKLSGVTGYGVRYGYSSNSLDMEEAVTDQSGITSPVNVVLQNLSPNTTYYYEAYVIYNGQTRMASLNTFKTEKQVKQAEPIDLGLPSGVKWANLNMGAENEHEPGWSVGWGDVSHSLTSTSLSYYPMANPGGDLVNTDYDVALQVWGGDWRMPTEEEFQELIDNCDWTSETLNRTDGWRVTSRKDASKSIFLPITGRRYGSKGNDYGNGYYWTGTLDQNNTDNARAFVFVTNKQKPTAESLERCYGLAIRPVQGDYNVTASVTVGEATAQASTAAVPVTITGDPKKLTEWGLLVGTSQSLTASNKVDGGTSVPGLGGFTVDVASLTPGQTYYYQAYAVFNGETFYSSVRSMTTVKRFADPGAPVDLGLSVKWSPWNMGASKVADGGEYFGWGDTDVVYSSYNGRHAVGNTNNNIAGTAYDVATANWGDKWRMPTMAELKELNDLYREKTTNYVDANGYPTGLTGFIIYAQYDFKVDRDKTTATDIVLYGDTHISKASCAKIFLPAIGYKDYTQTVSRSGDALYWSSEAEVRGASAKYMQVNQSSVIEYATDICIMLPVRPVYDENGSTTPGGNTVPDATAEAGSAVDLGLSVQWATCNVGATDKQPSSVGDYLAWGELQPKSTYTRESSPYWHADAPHSSGSTGNFDKIGEDIKGDTLYDAAAARWRGGWRMPTDAELEELYTNCTMTPKDNGVEFTSKFNGKKIFLPFGGYCSASSTFMAGSEGRYWSSTLYTKSGTRHNLDAYQMDVTSGIAANQPFARELGCSVRPVCPITNQQAARRKARLTRQK